MKKKTVVFIKLFLLIFIIISSACKTKKAISRTVELSSNVNVEANKTTETSLDSIFKNAHVGIYIVEPATNTVVESYQSNKSFLPSSNVKIATCYAALKYLGDSLVGLQYKENDSTVNILATGDPTFLNKNFPQQPILNWLQSKNQKKIFIQTPSYKAKPYGDGWSWDDYEAPFMAERSALPMYENAVRFYYNQSYKTIPHLFEKNFGVQFEASNGNYYFKVSRDLNDNTFNINPGKKTVDEVPFATFSNTIKGNNLLVNLLMDTLHQPIVFSSLNNNSSWKKLYSQSTIDVLQSMMYRSDNFIAEQLLLMLSNEKLRLMDDLIIIDSFLQNDFKDLPQQPRWVDGSGLSRYNLFSPEDLVTILNKINAEFGWGKITTIFPTATQGTLKYFNKDYRNKIFAKSGSMSNNYALSGYLVTNLNKKLTFSIMVNNYVGSVSSIRNSVEQYLINIINTN